VYLYFKITKGGNFKHHNSSLEKNPGSNRDVGMWLKEGAGPFIHIAEL
jgi:hypothetical protein